MTNKELLDKKIEESGKSITFLAKKCDISRSMFYKKLENKYSFTAREIKVLCDELRITKLTEMQSIFFAE